MSEEDVRPNRLSVDALWEMLLANEPEEDTSEPLSARSVNDQLVPKIFEQTRNSGSQVAFRLSGAPVQGHAVSVKTAAGAMASFQEIVTSVGASISSISSLFGQLPTFVRSGTELFLSPRVSPGSIIFDLSSRSYSDDLFELDVPSLLDQSVGRLVEVLSLVGDQASSEEDVAGAVRELGPRAAKHLRALADIIVGDGVDLDISWMRQGKDRRKARLNRRSASYLRDVIRSNEIDVSEEIYEGTLVTVSLIDDAAIILDDGDKLPVKVPKDFPEPLGDYFGHPVRVLLRVEVRRSTSTGRESASYTLLAIQSPSAPSSALFEVADG